MGARRYANDIASLTRCRTAITLDSKVDTSTAREAQSQIDSLIATLAQLKQQHDNGAP
jgi:hypothetical protein